MHTQTQSETKLKRGKRLWKNPGGKVERISADVLAHLEGKRRPKESFDAFLRRLLGLPNRKGVRPQLLEAWVLPSLCFPSEAKAKGHAVMQAAWQGKSSRPEKPVRVRETP